MPVIYPSSSDNVLNAVPICISDRGEGQALIFMHGTAASAKRWQAVADFFVPNRRVIEYDRRGRGLSGDADDYSIEAEADDLLFVSKTVSHGDKVDVVAHSHGALIALEALCRDSRIFRRIVLYEAPLAIPGQCEFIDIEQVTALEKEREALGDEAATLYFLRHFPQATEAEIAVLQASPLWPQRVTAAHTLARELRAAHAFSPDADKLRQCTPNCLILFGGDSPTPFATSAKALESWLPASQVVMLPGQKHMGMDTNPELMFDVISQFLS